MPVWLIQFLISVAIAAASAIVDMMFADDGQKKRGVRGSLQTGGVNSRSFVVGTYGLAGHLEYVGTWGDSGGMPNAYLTHVISLGDMDIDSISELWVNGEKATMNQSTGHIAQGYPILEYNDGASDHLWLEFFDGSQTTANSFMTSKFGSHADRPWTTDMIGRGIPYVTMTALVNRELWNSIPKYMFQVKGIPLYDPRLDSTAGGSGPQRANDDTTWAWSENPVVIIYNILMGIRYNGDWMFGMQSSVDQSRLPYDIWSAAMDVCDQNISLNAGGTEPRFRAGAEIVVGDTTPVEVISGMLAACSGRMTEVAGVYKIVAGDPGASVGTFTDDSLIISESQTLSPFPQMTDTVNGVTATYPEPDAAWELKEAPPRHDSTFETEDDGHRLVADFQLGYVYSQSQAQRIMLAALKDGRKFIKHTVVARPSFGVFEPLDVVTWTSSFNGYVSKQFLVTTTEEGPNGNQFLGLHEIDSTAHNWTPSTDEIAVTPVVLTVDRPAAQPMSGWTVAGATGKDDAGVDRWPTLQVGYSGPQSDVKDIHIQVRLASSGDIVFDGIAPYSSPYSVLLNIKLLPNTSYETRGKYIPYSNRATDWSAWLAATTPDVRLTSSDFSDTINSYQDFMGASLTELLEFYARLDNASSDEFWSKYSDKQELRTEITSATGAITAAYTSDIYAATGPSSAIVVRLDGLEATMPSKADVSVTDAITVRLDDTDTGLIASADAITALEGTVGYDSGSATFRMQTGYTPDSGFTSKIGFQVRASSGDSWNDVGLYLQASATTGGVLMTGPGGKFYFDGNTGNITATGNFSFGT